MTQIINGAIVFDAEELAWFAENYGDVEWIAYFAGMDEITTHDRHYPGDEVKGEPFTEETVRTYLAEFDGRFGPGSPLAIELQDPSYAIALHYGKPAFGSHEHGYAINPPGGSFAKPGDCACGHTWAEAEKRQAAELAEVEWAVYVDGLGALTRQDIELPDEDPENPAWTEDTARKFVEFANGEMQQIHRTAPNQAVLLHYGQPVDEAAGAQ
jgi:hypothetical protein